MIRDDSVSCSYKIWVNVSPRSNSSDPIACGVILVLVELSGIKRAASSMGLDMEVPLCGIFSSVAVYEHGFSNLRASILNINGLYAVSLSIIGILGFFNK